MCEREEDAAGRWTMKEMHHQKKAKVQQEAERTPWVDLLSELPVLMRERWKNKQKDFEFLSSWLLWWAARARLNPPAVRGFTCHISGTRISVACEGLVFLSLVHPGTLCLKKTKENHLDSRMILKFSPFESWTWWLGPKNQRTTSPPDTSEPQQGGKPQQRREASAEKGAFAIQGSGGEVNRKPQQACPKYFFCTLCYYAWEALLRNGVYKLGKSLQL